MWNLSGSTSSKMTGIQLRLQKELFTPSDEQLLALAHCFKASSEKKSAKNKDIYLCIVNEASNQPGYQVSVDLLFFLLTSLLNLQKFRHYFCLLQLWELIPKDKHAMISLQRMAEERFCRGLIFFLVFSRYYLMILF